MIALPSIVDVRLLSALALLSLSAACNQSDAQAKAESSAAATPAVPSDAAAAKSPAAAEVAAAPATGKPKYDEEAFELSLTGPAAVKVGETASYTVTLAAKNGYKVNAEYPVKFKFVADPTVLPQKETLTREDAQVEKTKVQIPAQIVVKQPGAHLIGGKLSFSVCTEERCLIEKRDLALPVTAS